MVVPGGFSVRSPSARSARPTSDGSRVRKLRLKASSTSGSATDPPVHIVTRRKMSVWSVIRPEAAPNQCRIRQHYVVDQWPSAGASNETMHPLDFLLHSLAAGITITGMGWVFIIAAVFFVSAARTHDAGTAAVITVAVAFLMWLASVWLTPFRRCRICKGTGRFRGVLSTWAQRLC